MPTGLTQQLRSDATMTHLAMRSVAKLEAIETETGEPLVVHQFGSIKLARTPEFVPQIEEEVARGKALGIPVEHVSAAEAERRAPFLHAEAALAAWYNASDLYLDRSICHARIFVPRSDWAWRSATDAAVTAIGTRGRR